MFFYEVAPADRAYQAQNFLTYQSEIELTVGQLVVVKLRTKNISAIVVASVGKPSFTSKDITQVIKEAIVPAPSLTLLTWITKHYPGPLGLTASLFTPPAIQVKKDLETEVSIERQDASSSQFPRLTDEQAKTVQAIAAHSPASTHIVHGDTGTGKTRIYIELAIDAYNKNKSALILTPEINLTPQLVKQFRQIFPKVYVVHSGITASQRRTAWLAMSRETSPCIVIGPRSALFCPVKNIGLIVLDEFHDGSYKQDQAPRYRASRVAAALSKIHNAPLVLGSATPPIEDYFYAVSKGANVYRLTQKATQTKSDRTLTVVDLSTQEERSQHSLLSKTLLGKLQETLNKQEQSLVFLNKRGTARQLLCQDCGWFAECERCDISYTYHEDSHTLICHTCGKTEKAPHTCKLCGSANIYLKNPGTKLIVSSLQKVFPNAKIGRYDKDNSKEDSFEANHAAIHAGDVDILVGTQLLTKGHDLPKLTLVGVLLADNELQFPDYSSSERAYQILHQIAGRVGRGHLDGEVVVQTYNPSEQILEAVEHKSGSWQLFYEKELLSRKAHNFPPYSFTMKVEFARSTEKSAEEIALKTAAKLRQDNTGVAILNAAPSFFAKRNNKWHWQIIIKSKQRSKLLEVISQLPKNCIYDIEPMTLL